MKLNKQYLTILFLFSICYGQLGVGDTIPEYMGLPYCSNNETDSDSLFLHDFNGATNELGQHHIIWITIITSW